MGVGERLALAKETVRHAKTIIDDMRSNRAEYSSKDLSWRNVDLMHSLIEAFAALVEALEEPFNADMEREERLETEQPDENEPDEKDVPQPKETKLQVENELDQEEPINSRSPTVEPPKLHVEAGDNTEGPNDEDDSLPGDGAPLPGT